MTREEVFRWMLEAGWAWDGQEEDDLDGMFVKGEQALTFDAAVYLLSGWKFPSDELRGGQA